jgi:hypothetical protein
VFRSVKNTGVFDTKTNLRVLSETERNNITEEHKEGVLSVREKWNNTYSGKYRDKVEEPVKECLASWPR